MVRLWRLQAGLAAAALAVVVLVAEAVLRAADLALFLPPGTLPLATLVVAGVAAWRWPPVHYAHWRYRVAERALEVRHGVLLRTTSVIPYYRVQHIDVVQGPVERALGLSRLVIRTAAATTDAELPGIASERAEELRVLILDRAGTGDAV